MKKMILVERNSWEGETFKSIIEITDEQIKFVEKWIEDTKGKSPSSYQLLECNIDVDNISELNKMSSNSYMREYALCKFPDEEFIESYKDSPEQLFYKRTGLDYII